VGVFCAGLLGRKTSMANSLKVQLWLALREASESSDALVRVIVAGARLRSRDPEISDSFLKDLQDPRARVDSYHWDAMRAAAEWAPPWLGAAHIAPFLHDSDPDMRKAAVLVAGQLGLASLTLDLESLLSDQTVSSADRATVAAGASEALDRIAGKRPKWTAPPIGVRP
jgi:hypothetical protein